MSDKPAYIQDAPRLTANQVTAIDEHYGDRLRSLQSLDELIQGVVDTLAARGVLDRTYIIVTSDHGWHLGEHRLPFGKETPYEESIRAPMTVLGPDIVVGSTIDAVTLNIDLAPTIADLTGATIPAFVDGRSLVPLLRGQTPASWRQSFLVEHLIGGAPISYPNLGTMPQVPTYRALRSTVVATDRLYVEYANGESELYDTAADRYQLDNMAPTTSPKTIAGLAAHVEALRVCHDDSCRATEDAPITAASRSVVPLAQE